MICMCGVGSGSLAAMAVFEDRFKPDMEVCIDVPISLSLFLIPLFVCIDHENSLMRPSSLYTMPLLPVSSTTWFVPPLFVSYFV